MMHSLYLFPAMADQEPPDLEAVQTCLTGQQFIGNNLDQHHFLVGERFFEHVIFAGCSPSMQLQPPDDDSGQFVHLRLLGIYAVPKQFVSSQYSKPRCPTCRLRIKDWQQLSGELPPCPSCGRNNTLESLDWRNYAARGRLLVEIRDVFPGEAVPGEQLLSALMAIDGQEWRYGWAESS